MTIEELNKIIKEELDAFMQTEDENDEIKVTTDQPEDKGEEAVDTLRQIFNLLKPIVEPEDEEVEDEEVEDLGDDADEEEDSDVSDEADEDMKEGKDDEKDEDMKEEVNSLNESFDGAARFKKLANIIK